MKIAWSHGGAEVSVLVELNRSEGWATVLVCCPRSGAGQVADELTAAWSRALRGASETGVISRLAGVDQAAGERGFAVYSRAFLLAGTPVLERETRVRQFSGHVLRVLTEVNAVLRFEPEWERVSYVP